MFWVMAEKLPEIGKEIGFRFVEINNCPLTDETFAC